MNETPLLQQNLHLLKQLLRLSSSLSPEQYGFVDESLIDSSIGGHCRHIVDHYQSFADGFSQRLGVSGGSKNELQASSLEAPAQVTIDYDSRQRKRILEIDLSLAMERISGLLSELEQFAFTAIQPEVYVVQNIFADSKSRPLSQSGNDANAEIAKPNTPISEVHRQQSTLARELTFLHSHTTHHLAFIKILMNYQKIPLLIDDEEMGLAPATLRHREAVKCAH